VTWIKAATGPGGDEVPVAHRIARGKRGRGGGGVGSRGQHGGITRGARRGVGAGRGRRAAPAYDEGVVRLFVLATMFWGVVGFVMGDLIAWQLVFPQLNLGLEWTTFGRLRPVHTSAVIFAFGGNALLGTSLYVVQRTCRAPLFGGPLPARFLFWGYQLFIVLAASGYVLGVTQSREYAEPEWYVDLWLTAVWVLYLVIFLGTILRRREPHIYVSNWYYLAFIVTIAVLHIGNNLAVPVSLFGAKSYSLFGGVQDAMTEWWYGHNAVGFFLTAGFLGMMYYFLPKQANRPVWSYRLSIINFWALIFMYIWAGPAPPALHGPARVGPGHGHDLHHHALGALLGQRRERRDDALGRLGQAAHRPGAPLHGRLGRLLRHEHARGAAHGHQAGQRALALHRLDRGPRPLRALGWNAFITFGAVYYLVPRLWDRERLYSTRLVEWHFWIATLGIVLYITAMWVSGVMQGLMWRSYDQLGLLQYSFVETVAAMKPYYVIRALGGVLFLTGGLIMAYNLWRTIRGDVRQEDEAQPARTSPTLVPAPAPAPAE
jgi:cytochrome c oxidase cbb3-type subunit 1